MNFFWKRAAILRPAEFCGIYLSVGLPGGGMMRAGSSDYRLAGLHGPIPLTQNEKSP